MFPQSKPNFWADEYIYGVEINPDLALATKVNMVLHGDGNINIYAKDGLADFDAYRIPSKVSTLAKKAAPADPYHRPVNGEFDFVLSNPPFSIKPDDATKADYKRRFEFGTGRNRKACFWSAGINSFGRRGELG